MVAVRIFKLDGYRGWVPTRIVDATLDEFTPAAIATHITKGETSNLKDLGEKVKIKPNTITVVNEEDGYIVTLL